MNDFVKQILVIILFLLFIGAGVFIFSGCNSGWTWPGQKPIQIESPDTPQKQLWHTVKESNWLVTLAIPIIALGAVAMFNGAAKLGMSAVIFGAVNLFMALATARFALWMSIFGLIGSGLAVAASILSKNWALIDIIRGAQKLKEASSSNLPFTNKTANGILAKEQSPTTQRIVQTVKTNLKLKGEL